MATRIVNPDWTAVLYGEPYIYLCTEYEGEPTASMEIKSKKFSIAGRRTDYL
jgi:hypothetical protein